MTTEHTPLTSRRQLNAKLNRRENIIIAVAYLITLAGLSYGLHLNYCG